MDPMIVTLSILAVLAAASGAWHSFHDMRAARDAEMQLRVLVHTDQKLRAQLLEQLSKKDVGEKTLEDLETRVAYLLMQMPRELQPLVRAALKQPSKQGQRDYLLKLAFDDSPRRHAASH